MQIDVIRHDHQCALTVLAVDSTGGVGEDRSFDPHSAKHPHGKCDLGGRVAFVKMYAALHGGEREVTGVADHQAPGVTDSGRAGEAGNFGIRNLYRLGQFVGEAAEAGTEHERDPRVQGSLPQDESCRGFGVGELVAHAEVSLISGGGMCRPSLSSSRASCAMDSKRMALIPTWSAPRVLRSRSSINNASPGRTPSASTVRR